MMKKNTIIRLCALALGILMTVGFLCACSLIAGGPEVTLAPTESNSPETTEETTAEVTTAEQTTEETTAEETTAEETTAEETTAEETTAETTVEETTAAPEPEVPWNMVLVNPWYPISESHEIELKWVSGSHKVDARCADALKQMLKDCEAAGYSPLICSSFRTWEDQTILFERRVNLYISRGYGEAQARVLAAKEVAVPGTSEHQLGLAVDIVSLNYQILDDAQANTPTQKWLMANCHKYGFILRYPKGTTDITGIIYEPWHYRYVGVEAATEIMTRGITFEEYLGKVGAPETSAETTANEETN